ncbi:hypothetical protein BSKO_11165 [Bryopsis sp. KO-2023]|nr:hypothetical protein BSKO_11165 [Bryopsis sp. KO-2023]
MDALNVGLAELESVRAKAEEGLFPRRDFKAPLTFAAAHTEVQRRDDARKLREESRKDARSKGRSPQSRVPTNKGAVIGGRRDDLSPWWLVMKDYFREVTQEDVMAVIPCREALDATTDPAFRIPRVGRDTEVIDEAEFWANRISKKPRTDQSTEAPQAANGADGRPEGDAVEDTPRGAALVSQRRSDRLASKLAAREGSLSLALDSGRAEEIAEASPWLGLPQTPVQDVRQHLLDVCCGHELAVLASEIDAIEGGRGQVLGLGVGECQARGHQDEDDFDVSTEQKAALLDTLNKAVVKHPPLSGDFVPEVVALAQPEKGQPNGNLDVEMTDAPAQSADSNRQHPPEANGNISLASAHPSPDAMHQGPAQECNQKGCDPMHPATQILLNRGLPPHVLECATSVATGMMSNGQNHQLPGILESPATPPPAPGCQSDVETPPNRYLCSSNGFRFPALTNPDSTPVFNSKTRSSMEDPVDLNCPVIDEGKGVAGGNGDVRGSKSTTARRRRKDVDYNVLAGGKTGPPQNQTAGKRKAQKSAFGNQMEALSNPTYNAVQNAIAQGGPDGDLESQWNQLDTAREQGLLEYAPDDEIMAEIIACQAELIQQSAANRQRLAKTVGGVLEHLPKMKVDRERRCEMEKDITECTKAIGEYRRDRKHASRKRQSDKGGVSETPAISPRRSRPPRQYGDEGYALASTATRNERLTAQGVGSTELIDSLTEREQGADTVCMVCGEGHSEPPNVIVYCERCDLAVHQDCYGVSDVPAGEWLCWPCVVHEEKLRRDGVPQSDIRPSRGPGSDNSKLEGGSRGVECALCPVKCGAFKMSSDGRKWVHVVCCHAHRETSILPGNICEAVEGVNDIPNSRCNVKCELCQRREGAVIRCSYGSCSKNLHVLCARREGLAVMTPSQKLGQTSQFTCNAYCRDHNMLRNMETITPARAVTLAASQKDKSANRTLLDFDLKGSDSLSELTAHAAPQNLLKGTNPQYIHQLGGSLRSSLDMKTAPPVGQPMSEQERQKALESLAAKQRDYEALRQLRLNLETVRVLSDQCKKRERAKAVLTNLKITRFKSVLADVEKYYPLMDTVLPPRQQASGRSAAPTEEPAATPTISNTFAGSASEQLLPVASGPPTRGRPSGSRSTRVTAKRMSGAMEVDNDVGAAQTSRRNARGTQGRARRGIEMTPPPESETATPVNLGLSPQSTPGQTRTTRATTRRSTRNSAQLLQHQNPPPHSHQTSQIPDSEAGPSQNDAGPCNNVQKSGEGGGEAAGRRLVLGKRSRSRRGGGPAGQGTEGGESQQTLAPERALTGDEVQEINSEIRQRGYAYVRQDEMGEEADCNGGPRKLSRVSGRGLKQ